MGITILSDTSYCVFGCVAKLLEELGVFMERKDLHYTYSSKAVPGDDPSKTKEDATRFSRHEEYEVLTLINSFTDSNGKTLPLRSQQIIEWMIHDHLPSNVQGRQNVTNWIVEKFPVLKSQYPR